METGHIVFVAKGRDGACLEPFFKQIKRSKVKIKAASIDMSKAYIAAVLHNLVETDIVFDHFHVVKLINKKLDELRKKSSRGGRKTESSVSQRTSLGSIEKSRGI